MVAEDFLVNFVSITASLVTIVGAYEIFVQVQKYRQRPVPRIGILPIRELSDGKIGLHEIGAFESFQEFAFKEERFAKQLEKLDDVLEPDFHKDFSTRIGAQDGLCELFMVVQNLGRSNIDWYKLTITFLEETSDMRTRDWVQIRDVQAETLEVDGLSCDPETYVGNEWKDRVPGKEIREAFDRIGLPEDFVSFTGTLGSGTFEMIHMKLGIKPELGAFYVFYTIDCPQLPLRKKTYGQRVVVDRV